MRSVVSSYSPVGAAETSLAAAGNRTARCIEVSHYGFLRYLYIRSWLPAHLEAFSKVTGHVATLGTHPFVEVLAAHVTTSD